MHLNLILSTKIDDIKMIFASPKPIFLLITLISIIVVSAIEFGINTLDK